MKKEIVLSLAIILLGTIMLQAQTTTIPDVNFEQALIDLGIDSDGIINQSVANSDIAGVTSLFVYNKNISDLTGIEGFVNLSKLYCNYNQITSLDVSQNLALTVLSCYNNQLTGLDVTQNTALTVLSCGDNPISGLDITQNTALTQLYCHNNQLTGLDLSQNTALTYLSCVNNQLTSLDVSHNPDLTYIICYKNQITTLDLSQNTALIQLSCNYNALTNLDLSQNISLTHLQCHGNALTSLDVSQNPDLIYIVCSNNQLSSLNLSQNTALYGLYCDNNQLSSLDLSSNTVLESLGCFRNQITNLNTTQNVALRNIQCQNNALTTLDVTQNTALTDLWCDHNQLTSLDVSQNIALTRLYCYNNALTNLNVSYNTLLNDLRCYYNPLTSMDLTHNTALKTLYCTGNQLTSLDLSQNTKLTTLLCYTNSINDLDLSQNTELTYVSCGNNQLTDLDLSNNARLTYLICSSNQLTALDLSHNTALVHLTCYFNQLTDLDLSQNSALKQINCSYNELSSFDMRNGNNAIISYLYANNNPTLTCIAVDDESADHSNWRVDPGVELSNDCVDNLPPVAVCNNLTVNANENCEAMVTPEQVGDGSYDPDGDLFILNLDQPGPFPLGETIVTLTATDEEGEFSQCTATITVDDVTPPEIITKAIEIEFVVWPPNHKYITFTLSDLILSVNDNCANLVIDDINIISATSDEPEDAEGEGDGSTLNDIIIADDCKSVQLRKERDENLNGRIYTVHLELDDGNGNTNSAVCQVQVPISKGGVAVDDGPVYEVVSICGNKSSFITENNTAENQLINYPNPFSNKTTIEFSVAGSGNSILRVYNSTGVLVATLYEGYTERGQLYKVEFDGSSLSKGFYLYNLQTENGVNLMKKMILSK